MMRRPQDRLSRAPEATMLLIAGLIVILIALLSYQNGRLRAAASDELRINRRIQELTAPLQSTLTDAETGQRGYLLTGRDEYLTPYNSAVAAIPGILLKLEAAAVPRPGVAERVGALEPVVAAKVKELAYTIQVRRDQGLPPAEAIVKNDRGKALMDDVRAACEAIQASAESRVAQYSGDAESSANRLSLV